MAIDGTLLQQAGQGDAFILPAANTDRLTERLDMVKLEKQRKAAAEQKAKEERDRRLDELMKWNPEQAWYPHTEQLNKKVSDVYNYATELKMKGATSPEAERQLKQMQWDAEVTAKKSQDLKSLYPQLRQEISSQDKYTNKDYLYSKLNDWAFGMDGKKDVNEVDFAAISNIYNDPKAFNVRPWSEDFAKSLPEAVSSQFGTMSTDGGTLLVDKETKSKFFELDANGNVKIDPTTKAPIINISPETVNIAMQEPRFRMFVESELAKPGNEYKTAKDIVKEVLAPYAVREQKQTISKGYSDKEKEDDSDITNHFDTEDNFNLNKKGGTEREVVKSWAPHEVRIGQKEGDTPLFINGQTLIDPNTNSTFKDVDGKPIVGDQKVTVTRLRLMPFDEETGKILPGSKSEIDKYKNDHKVGYKWVAGGIMHTINEYGEKKEVPVMIPYDEVKVDLEKKKKINLDKRPPSEYSHEELTYFIKVHFPKLSADEKAKKYLEYRNMK